jgi:hypothetical protein
MRKLIKPVLALLVVAIVALSATIYRTGAPLARDPGVVYRLSSYLTQNRVETTPVSVYPERERPSYYRPLDSVYEAALASAREQGWRIKASDEKKHRFHAVARTPWLGFKNDIRIQLTRTNEAKTALHFQGESRRGLADLGQNTAYLVALRQGIDDRL